MTDPANPPAAVPNPLPAKLRRPNDVLMLEVVQHKDTSGWEADRVAVMANYKPEPSEPALFAERCALDVTPQKITRAGFVARLRSFADMIERGPVRT